MEVIRIESNIKEIAVKNEKDEVITVLRINMIDSNTATRFAKLIQNLDRVSENYSKEAKMLSDKYDGRPINKDNFDVNQVIDYSSAYVSYITKCIEEINAVFGDNTVQNVYKECYEINPDFVPDEYALMQFVDGVIPVMNGLFNKKFEENKKRYNVSKRGKHTKTKDELLEEMKNGKRSV